MSAVAEPAPELRALVERLISGALTPEEAARLDAWVAGDPAACEFYVRYLHLHASVPIFLPETAEEEDDHAIATHAAPPWEKMAPRFPRLQSGVHWIGQSPVRQMALTVVLSYLFFGLLMVFVDRTWRTPTPDAEHAPVAARHGEPIGKLAQQVDCTWTDGAEWKEGATLYAGQALELEDGSVQVVLRNGTRLVLEGPAGLVFHDLHSTSLTRGRLSAAVAPRAAGFRVTTQSAAVEDLGTEFNVAAGPGATEVVVFEGAVNVTSLPANGRPGRAQRLEAGQALQVSVEGVATPVDPLRLTAARPFGKGRLGWRLIEDFNFAPGPLPADGAWSGDEAWTIATDTLTQFGGEPPRASGCLAIDGKEGVIRRDLGTRIDFDAEGRTYFFSMTARKQRIDQDRFEFFWLGLRNRADQSLKAGFGFGSFENMLLGAESYDVQKFTRTSALNILKPDVPYFYAMKLVTHAALPDEYFSQVFFPDQPLPLREPAAWQLSLTHDMHGIADLIQFEGGAAAHYRVDTVRGGRSWPAILP